MPRLKRDGSLENHIGSIISNAAAEIAAAVRRDMAAQLQQLIGQGVYSATPPVSVRSSRRVGNPGGKGIKRNIPKHCIFPDCKNPSQGPRWSFLCEKHLDTPKAERQKLLTAWKSANRGGNAASTAPAAKKRRGRRRGGRRAAQTA